MVFIIIFYLNESGIEAIETNNFMKKNKNAYYEACQVMIEENSISSKILQAFDSKHLLEILKPYKRTDGVVQNNEGSLN